MQQWLAESSVRCEALPASELSRAECVLRLQVTTHSTLGAVAYETGGLLVDHGWLRVLGSGHPRLQRSLASWNAGRTMDGSHRPPPILLVADDVLGGCFAINGGGLGNDVGDLYYFAPDTLRWERLSIGYTAFLQWALTADNLAQFYSSLRWPSWQTEIASLTGDQGILVYPFLVAAGPPIGDRSRSAVPMAELYGLLVDSPALPAQS